MKVRTTIITAGATVALLVPAAANAMAAKTLPIRYPDSLHKSGQLHVIAKSHTALTSKAKTSKPAKPFSVTASVPADAIVTAG